MDISGVDVGLIALSPLPLMGVLAAGLLHARACSILAGRGRLVPWSQRASYWLGLALILLATQTGIDSVGEQSLLSVHMVQHLLIADVPAPLLLYGLRAPVLYFFWPRPILVAAARSRWLRAVWRTVRRPPVALGTWLVVLYAWHLPAMYELALTNRAAHDLEHVSFALTGVLAWWPLMDPTHHRVEGRLWKAGYVLAARTVGGVLGIVLLTWPRQVYDTYGDGALAFGVSPLADQRTAGGIMMLLDFVIMTIAATYFVATSGSPERPRPTDQRAAPG